MQNIPLRDIPSSPIANYMGKDVDLHLFTTSLLVVVESDKTIPKPRLPN